MPVGGLTLCQMMEEKNFCTQVHFPTPFTRRAALIHIPLENCSVYPQDNPMRILQVRNARSREVVKAHTARKCQSWDLMCTRLSDEHARMH